MLATKLKSKKKIGQLLLRSNDIFIWITQTNDNNDALKEEGNYKVFLQHNVKLLKEHLCIESVIVML